MSIRTREYMYSTSNKREQRSLLFHPHHLLTSVNLTNNLDEFTTVEQLFDESQWQSNYPVPINSPTGLANRDKRLDPRISLVYEKETHQKLLQQIQHKHQDFQKNKRKILSKTASSIQSGYIKAYADIFASNPDPYFSGAYNWYFTGTNMIVNETLDGDQWLYHVTGPRFDELKLSKIKYKKDSGLKLKKKKSNILPNELLNHLQSGGMIYELYQQNEQVTIRQKHKLTTIYQNKIIHQYETPDKVPLVSACTVNGSKQKLITIDANRMMRINYLNKSKTIEYNLLTDKEFNSDNWSCLRPFNIGHNTFTYTNRRIVRIFDSRKHISIVQPTLAFEFGKLIDCCEEIISIEPSVKNNNVLYVSTTHKLFCIDIRQLNLNNTRLLKWNHQLKCHPTTICILDKQNMTNNVNSGELIIVGGTITGDLRLCETKMMTPSSPPQSSPTDDSNYYYSTYLPQKPINIFESYDQVKMRGHCLEPITCVAQQIRLSTTGMALCQPIPSTKSNQNQFYLLQQNCLGDIFAQNFTNKLSIENKQTTKMVCDSFIEWDNKLKSLVNENESFCATDLTTFSSMAACLAKNIMNPNGVGGFDDIVTGGGDDNTNQQSATIIIKENEEEEIRRLSRPKRWQQSLKKLKSYTDALASDMLDIWEIETENKLKDLINYSMAENTAAEVNESITQEMNEKEKVMNWLNVTKSEISFDGNNFQQSTQKNENPQKQSAAATFVLPLSSNLVEPTAETIEMDVTMVSTTIENTNQSIKKKKSRRLRVFVPGF